MQECPQKALSSCPAICAPAVRPPLAPVSTRRLQVDQRPAGIDERQGSPQAEAVEDSAFLRALRLTISWWMNDSPSAIGPALPADPSGELVFTPVSVKGRRDGWTAERQRDFIRRLMAGQGISPAARAGGMSRQSAYALRSRSDAASFAAAWDRALACARSRSSPPGPTGYQRAIEGMVVPLRHGKRIIGYRRKYDDRALGHMLTTLFRLRERGP